MRNTTQRSKHVASIAIAVGAMATLGGVAFAAASSIDNTPPPAFIPGVSAPPTAAGTAPATPLVTTAGSLPPVTVVDLDRGGDDRPAVTAGDDRAVGDDRAAGAVVTVTSIDDHGGRRRGSDDPTPTATPNTNATTVDDHGSGGHGADDAPTATGATAATGATTATTVDDHGSGRHGGDDGSGHDSTDDHRGGHGSDG